MKSQTTYTLPKNYCALERAVILLQHCKTAIWQDLCQVNTKWWVVFYKDDKVKIAEDTPTELLAKDRTYHETFTRVPDKVAFRTLDSRLDFLLISVHLNLISISDDTI